MQLARFRVRNDMCVSPTGRVRLIHIYIYIYIYTHIYIYILILYIHILPVLTTLRGRIKVFFKANHQHTEIINRKQTFQCWHCILSTVLLPWMSGIQIDKQWQRHLSKYRKRISFNGENKVFKTLQAFEVVHVKCSDFWNMSPRQWIIGGRRFETVVWSHLPRSTFIRHSTLEDDTIKQSRNVRYQSHGEAETNSKSSETSRAEEKAETCEKGEKKTRKNKRKLSGAW